MAWLGSSKKQRSLHGEARFATDLEIKKSGLLGEDGVVVGKYKDQYLMFPGQQFVLLAAPTRSGKGVGIVIPNCLTYSQSLVVMDIKQENYKLTSGFRAKYGHEVHLFNPFAEDARTSRFNPLEYISTNPHFTVGDILSIGYALYPQDAKDAFWNDQARNLFLGLTLYLVETPSLPRTLGEVLRQSSGKGKPIKEYITEIINTRIESGNPLSNNCLDALNRFISNSDNTLASILASFNAPLVNFANPIVDAATSANDFDLRELRRKKITIYIGITPDKLAESALLINLLFSQLVNLNTKTLPEQDPSLKYQCLLLMDEFTSIGKVGIIAKSVSYMAGYNLRLMPIIQSLSQLESVYGKEDAKTFVTNHAMQIIYSPRENNDAKEYSEMLGYDTVKSKSVGRSRGTSSNSSNSGSSENVSDQRRALMLPQELKELGFEREIIILENVKPIICGKIIYHKDDNFTVRLLPAAEPKTLDVDTHIAKVEKRIRIATVEDLSAIESAAILGVDISALKMQNEENPSEEDVAQYVDDFFAQMTESAEMAGADVEDYISAPLDESEIVYDEDHEHIDFDEADSTENQAASFDETQAAFAAITQFESSPAINSLIADAILVDTDTGEIFNHDTKNDSAENEVLGISKNSVNNYAVADDEVNSAINGLFGGMGLDSNTTYSIDGIDEKHSTVDN
ncbi:type IV secretion system protein VirD4 (plasmid) [Iodobacter fluviatilis]|uniref:Type IV secretion system protein VirD4 n=2 Tax=Iodobacter fluviatilis TaxID=537 RepID=A0A7G3GFK6_9NEIS|nr:type IV secretion system protein VirD4 [Iodobacter fluviatilis]QBC45903.1 type IV secretion system protein VirD4 [Iodobacter fluviatilis]